MTYQDFIALTNDELRRRIAGPQPYESFRHYEIEDYRDELNRRVAERQTTWLVRLTWVLAVLTVVLTVVALATLALLVRGG